MESKRLRIQVYKRQVRRDGVLYLVRPGRTVKETIKGLKNMTGLESLVSLWTTDGFRLDPRGEMWQLVDHDSVLIAADKTDFPAAAIEPGPVRPKRSAASVSGDDDASGPSKKPRKASGATSASSSVSSPSSSPSSSPPPAAESDGGVSTEYRKFLLTEGRDLMNQWRRENPHADPRQALRSVAAAWSKHPSNPKNSEAQENHSPTPVSFQAPAGPTASRESSSQSESGSDDNSD